MSRACGIMKGLPGPAQRDDDDEVRRGQPEAGEHRCQLGVEVGTRAAQPGDDTDRREIEVGALTVPLQ